MFVIATAGHVDHGKSTLVRALTGMEPDRWAQERERGMTIDLGYAWTTLPQGPTLAFVDVPGHERFIGNMLAGIGPAPAVMMVVSADEGWREQSAEHLAAIDALGLEHGLLAVTRSDLVDPSAAMTQALQHIRRSSLGEVRAVAVSGTTGFGLHALRVALAEVVGGLPSPRIDGRVRLWVDRSFTIRGSGTVVTGTLASGTLSVGDTLVLHDRPVRIRGLQTLGRPAERVEAVARVAVNLKGPAPQEIRRGDALITPESWASTSVVEARVTGDAAALPTEGVLHLGAGAFPVRIRPLNREIVRLTLAQVLPLEPGDRGILRNPGLDRLEGGVEILDVAPPPLLRRGAAVRRGEALREGQDLAQQVARRGAVPAAELLRLGVDVAPRADVLRMGEWLIAPERWRTWAAQLAAAVEKNDQERPLQPGLTLQTARRVVDLPDGSLLVALATAAGLAVVGPRVQRPGAVPSLGPAEKGVSEIERRLTAAPFAAPDRPELDRLGLGRSQLAAAESIGRILRLPDDVVLLPTAPELALRLLGELSQPFTTSQARAALDTTRRVAIPLLEHLDKLGLTRQPQPGQRTVVTTRGLNDGRPRLPTGPEALR